MGLTLIGALLSKIFRLFSRTRLPIHQEVSFGMEKSDDAVQLEHRKYWQSSTAFTMCLKKPDHYN